MAYGNLTRAVARPHRGAAELGAVVALYAAYELVRGIGGSTLDVAQANTRRIVELERSLGLLVEDRVQDAVAALPGMPAALALAYVTLHLGATATALTWLHRRRRDRFPLVRNALIAATALSLVVYVLYPAAPPRLAGIGFTDTVSEYTHVDLNSSLLGSLYNPFAAVPSMHFGYALLVGAALHAYARTRTARVAGALYPPFMLLVIVATGNHFLFDAAAGAAVVAAAWALARALTAGHRPIAVRSADR